MNKSKILAIAASAALVGSMAAATALSASAAGIGNASDIASHSVGVTGSFNNWESDVALTNNGSGVYEGTIEVDNVTEAMIAEQTTDDGSGNVPTGKKGITFKVRLDGDWTDSWGEYESAYARTWNSQTNCCADGVNVGDSVKIHVTFDTTKNSADAIADSANSGVDADSDVDYTFLPVTYTVDITPGTAQESSEESKEESKAESSTAPASTADTTTPATGDTTSAVALVAVVLASLGASVVMTKKASAKD